MTCTSTSMPLQMGSAYTEFLWSLEGWGRWSAIFKALKVSEGKKRMIILSEDLESFLNSDWTTLLYHKLYAILDYTILSFPILHFITQQLWLFLVFWCLRNVSFIVIFIDCFKLLVSQKNNVCVYMCVCVCVCVHACVHACVCVRACLYACVCVYIHCCCEVFCFCIEWFLALFYWIVDVLL